MFWQSQGLKRMPRKLISMVHFNIVICGLIQQILYPDIYCSGYEMFLNC